MATDSITRAAITAGLVVAAVLSAPTPANADGCERAPTRFPVVSGVPYVQQLYDVGRLTPLATGANIRVAVLDSGVDASHPQLQGPAVDRGHDYLHGAPDGRQDCVGHGTEVASLIAARHSDETKFIGLAPGATIVPVRVSENIDDSHGGQVADDGLGKLANAITWAADPNGGKCKIISLSVTTTQNDSRVERAVADAIQGGVVIVAAAGNAGSSGNPTPYPAAYPGVIGVAAVNQDGTHSTFSGHGPYVDLAAPGDKLTAAAPGGGGHAEISGTSAATPLVSATVALILERYRDQNLTVAQVTDRLLATTDPSPGGRLSPEFGYGLLNPYRAVTETLGPASPAPVPSAVHAPDLAALADEQRREQAQHNAMMVAGAGLAAVLLALLAASAIRRGRRRGWKPADDSVGMPGGFLPLTLPHARHQQSQHTHQGQ